MNDAYLDLFLKTLSDKGGQAWKEQDLLRPNNNLQTDDFDPTIRFLEQRGLITQERSGGYDYLITLTTQGRRFIETGGFTQDSKRINAGIDANKIARSAKCVAVWAIIISGLVALGVCLIELIYKRP